MFIVVTKFIRRVSILLIVTWSFEAAIELAMINDFHFDLQFKMHEKLNNNWAINYARERHNVEETKNGT